MKTQQRKFVVERKSGRRRITVQPASIWGDTDLRAFARKAEAEAPHLFEPEVVSEAPGQDSEMRTDPRPETHLNENTETRDDRQISASSIAGDQPKHPQQGDDPVVSSVPLGDEKSAGRRSSSVAKRRRAMNGSGRVDDTESVASVQSTAAQIDARADDLAVLEAENRRLKGLLSKQLLEQNIQLRKMLARFGVA